MVELGRESFLREGGRDYVASCSGENQNIFFAGPLCKNKKNLLGEDHILFWPHLITLCSLSFSHLQPLDLIIR